MAEPTSVEDSDGYSGGEAEEDVILVDDEAIQSLVTRVGAEVVSDGHTVISIDSLRALRLATMIGQEFGRSVSTRELLSCNSLLQLAAVVRESPLSATRQFPSPGKLGFRLWTFGWTNCLQWLFQCSYCLDAGLLRSVLVRLVRRHAALRLRLREPWDVQMKFMSASSAVQLMRASPHMTSELPTAATVGTVWSSCLQSLWPRWHTASPARAVADGIFMEVICPYDSVQAEMRKLKRNFTPPFQLALLRHPDGCPEAGESSRCHVCIMLCHAIADGTAVVPLLHDLAELCQEESARRTMGTPPAKRRFRPLSHFGAILEDRLLKSLDGSASEETEMYLDKRMDFFEAHFPEDRCFGYSQAFTVSGDEARKIRACLDAHVPGCSFETGILALVVMSIARVRQVPSVKVTFVHHGRDHPPGATDVIGFFTDMRMVEVPLAPWMSVLGVLNFLATVIRERRWRLPLAVEPSDVLFNIVPSPFCHVHPFRQVTWPTEGSSDLWQGKSSRPQGRRALELQIEQNDDAEWTVHMYLDETLYPPRKGRRFRKEWLRIVEELCTDPLHPVL